MATPVGLGLALSSEFLLAADRVKEAAEGSLKAARNTRARARRERITAQVHVSAGPLEGGLEMPVSWMDDEDTQKIKVG